MKAIRQDVPGATPEADAEGSVIKLETPRLRVMERPNWTMFLSRVAIASSQGVFATVHSARSVSSDGKGRTAAVAMDMSSLTMADILLQLEVLFKKENRNIWHTDKCNIVDNAVLEGCDEREKIHVLRGIQHRFDGEVHVLIKKNIEDFVVDTAASMIEPYIEEWRTARLVRSAAARTPARGGDCSAATCSTS